MSDIQNIELQNGQEQQEPPHKHNELPRKDEEFGNELGGARLLLQLGNKNQPNDIDVEAAVLKLVGNIDGAHSIRNGNTNTNTPLTHIMNASSANNNHNATNNNVSGIANNNASGNAALHGNNVATIANNSSNNSANSNTISLNHRVPSQNNKKRKLHFTDEITNLNEFQQWTGFLEEELNASAQNVHDLGDHRSEEDVSFLNDDGISTSSTATPRKHKRHRKKSTSGLVDQDLSHLDPSITATTDHEQLVQALMMNARELENEFVHTVSDYFKDNSQSQQHQQLKDKQHLKPQDDQQLQELAAQAVVAEAVNSEKLPNPDSLIAKKLKALKKKSKKKNLKTLSTTESAQLVAEVVKKTQPWLTNEEDIKNLLYDTAAMVVDDDDDDEDEDEDDDEDDQDEEVGLRKKKTSQHDGSDQQHRPQPRSSTSNASNSNVAPVKQNNSFTKEEIEAIDNYILAFSQIHNMTRDQICQRIWSNKRLKDDFWESLQKVLPNRKRASIYKHVRRSYHIFPVRAKWSPEDDLELGRLSIEHPGNWKAIGGLMGRMPEDCRDRYRNYVKCGSNRSSAKWTPHEERMLKAIVITMMSILENGGDKDSKNGNSNGGATINWTLASEQMCGRRSRIQCRYKWNKMLKNMARQDSSGTDGKSDEIFKDDITVTNSEKVRHLWLLNQLKDFYVHESEIEWYLLYNIYPYSKDPDQEADYPINDRVGLRVYYEMIKLKYFNDHYKFEQNGRTLVDELELLIAKINEITPVQ